MGTCSHAADSLCHGCNNGTPATVRVVCTCVYQVAHTTASSVQNRHLWKRYHHEKRLWGDALGEANLNEQLLWHGTSGLDPGVICKGLDGFDFRMVGVVIACSRAAHVSPVSDSS